METNIANLRQQWHNSKCVFISVINQLDAQNFCFTISLFHASTCFKHMCSKHVQAWNKLIVKQKFCASSWLITEINIQRCTVGKTSKCVIFQDRILKDLKCYNFLCLQQRHNCFPVASFANCVTTLYLLKSASANVSFYTSNSKMPNFELCDTLVANERYNTLRKEGPGLSETWHRETRVTGSCA